MVWHQGENHDWYMQHCHVKPIKYVTLLMPAMDDNITNHDTLLSPQCRAYCVLHNNPGETPLVTNNSIYIHICISKYFFVPLATSRDNKLLLVENLAHQPAISRISPPRLQHLFEMNHACCTFIRDNLSNCLLIETIVCLQNWLAQFKNFKCSS